MQLLGTENKGSLPYLPSCSRTGGVGTLRQPQTTSQLYPPFCETYPTRRASGRPCLTPWVPSLQQQTPPAKSSSTMINQCQQHGHRDPNNTACASLWDRGLPCPFFRLPLYAPCPSNGMLRRLMITSEINTIRVIIPWWHYWNLLLKSNQDLRVHRPLIARRVSGGADIHTKVGREGLRRGPPECTPAL